MTGDVKYYLPQHNGWDVVVGVSGGMQQNTNKGEEILGICSAYPAKL
jgi:iron complex outermembrane receptor protein